MTEDTVDPQEDEPDDAFVNYMPGMPTLSDEPSRVGRVVRKLLRRRGSLRPVIHEERRVVTTLSDD